MKNLVITSAMIGIVATIFDLLYHLFFLPTPIAPPLYFLTKLLVGFTVSFFVLKIFEMKGDVINSLTIGTLGALTFAMVLQAPQYRVQIGVIEYDFIVHLVHGIAFFLASYIILRYFEP